MPDPAFLAASPAPSWSAPTSPLPVTPVERASRYQVHEVLWGNRRRFVVRDTVSDTTIAIRTTRQIADSDLFRLNWGARGRPDPGSALRRVLNDSLSEPVSDGPSHRQCGRCRQLFASDPTPNPATVQDWWLCDSCHDKLMGTRRASTGTSPAGSITR